MWTRLSQVEDGQDHGEEDLFRNKRLIGREENEIGLEYSTDNVHGANVVFFVSNEFSSIPKSWDRKYSDRESRKRSACT